MRRVVLAVALVALPIAAEAQQSQRPAAPPATRPVVEQGTSAQQRRQPPSRGARTTICRGAAVPSGWILVDDMREPTMCGGENQSTLSAYNVWAIERVQGRPIGTVIDVCAVAPTPDGWEMTDVFRNKDACGHPSDPFMPNVKRIRRVR